MKIKDLYDTLSEKYPQKLKILKKGIFWILLEEEAFFMAKNFNFKLTSLDKNTIKIGFPDSSKNKWLSLLKEKNIGYVLAQKRGNSSEKNDYETMVIKEEIFEIYQTSGMYYHMQYSIDLEDFMRTKERILGLKKIDLEEKNEKNFLLQNKIEELYFLLMQLFMKLPRKERFYLREKIESIFLDTMELLYKYKYNLDERKKLIEKIFSNALILRDFCRMLYQWSFIKNDTVFLNIGERWIEILKICKAIQSKGGT